MCREWGVMLNREKMRAETAELLTWKGNYLKLKEERCKEKEEQLNTMEAQLVDRAKNMYDPKHLEQCVKNTLPFKKLQELTTQHEKEKAKIQEMQRTQKRTQAKFDEALAYVQGKAAAATEISAEAKGYSEGLEEASRLWAEKRKKEQAEEQQAEEQQVLSEERSMKKQKQANKNQKQQRQNWSAAIEEDNKKYSTPKGSGSKSRGTGR